MGTVVGALAHTAMVRRLWHVLAGGAVCLAAFVSFTTAAEAADPTLSPPSVAFSDLAVGKTSDPQLLTLTANGSGTVYINKVSLSGANAADFKISSNSCGASLPGGQSCTIAVEFAPQLTGTRQASLVVDLTHLESPYTVSSALSGNAIWAGPHATLVPAALDFGSHPEGTVTGQSVVLTNSGDATLTTSSIDVTGANPSDFYFTGGCAPTSLAPGASCTLSVEFAPAGNEAPGPRSATLRFFDNAPGSPETVPLSGTTTFGAPPPPAPSPLGNVTFLADPSLASQLLAFDTGRSHDFRLWTMDGNGNFQQPIAQTLPDLPPLEEKRPAWDPNGLQLAFDGYDQNFEQQVDPIERIYRTGPGEAPGIVASPTTGRPAYSRTGDLAFVQSGQITVLNRNGVTETQLGRSFPGSQDQDPAWSGDGRYIAYTVENTVGYTVPWVYVMNADGTHRTRVTSISGWMPAWSPSGNGIAFVHDGTGGSLEFGDIYTTYPDGSHLTRLTSNNNNTMPAWSYDGRWIAFVSALNLRVNLDGDIYVMQADGGGVRRLTHSPGGNEWPAWQPRAPAQSCFACSPQFRYARMRTTKFIVRRLTFGAGRTPPHGSAFLFALSAPAHVRIDIRRVPANGRPAWRRCGPKLSGRRRTLCLAAPLVGTLRRNAHSGPNSIPFSGRVGAHALRPGRYRASIVAADRKGHSLPIVLDFQVVRG